MSDILYTIKKWQPLNLFADSARICNVTRKWALRRGLGAKAFPGSLCRIFAAAVLSDVHRLFSSVYGNWEEWSTYEWALPFFVPPDPFIELRMGNDLHAPMANGHGLTASTLLGATRGAGLQVSCFPRLPSCIGFTFSRASVSVSSPSLYRKRT